MYRHQRQLPIIPLLVVLGVIIGVGFLINRGSRTSSTTIPTPTVIPTTPTLEPLPQASPLPSATPMPRANLSIPTAGVVASVVEIYLDGESWDVSRLGQSAGHLQGTAWFGESGNIVLAGHVEMADGSGGIFRSLRDLKWGDPVVLTLGDDQQQYAVTEVKTVAPNDLSVVYPTTEDQITLITCDSYSFLQNVYQDRLVVVATRVA